MVEIVFAGLVNDAHVIFWVVVLRGKHLINLAQFQRRFITFVVQTNCERHCSVSQSKSRLIFISFFPIPCASYQCSSAKRSSPLISSTWAEPLTLRHVFRREGDEDA